MKVAILDDTEYVVDILRNLMPEHAVSGFTEPEPFLKDIGRGDFDVIITDLRVPRYEAIQNIRRFKLANIACKVIVISAYFTEEQYLELIDCHIYKAVKKNTEYEWFEKVVEAVNK